MTTVHAAIQFDAQARPAGGGLFSLHFWLSLPAGPPIAQPALLPFMAFELRARSGAQLLVLQQPDWALPQQATTLRLAPGTPLELSPPLRLHFADPAWPAPAAGSSLVWTVPAPQAGVRIRVQLLLPEPLFLAAPLRFD